jgi:hypothetical protein
MTTSHDAAARRELKVPDRLLGPEEVAAFLGVPLAIAPRRPARLPSGPPRSVSPRRRRTLARRAKRRVLSHETTSRP